MKKFKNGLLVGLGALLGVTAGLVLNRKTGKALRKELNNAFDKDGVEGSLKVLQHEIAACGKEFLQTSKEIGEREDVQELIKKGKIKVEELKKEGQIKITALTDEGKKKINKLAKDTKKKIKNKKKGDQ